MRSDRRYLISAAAARTRTDYEKKPQYPCAPHHHPAHAVHHAIHHRSLTSFLLVVFALLADCEWIVLSTSETNSGLSHSASPNLRATSRPSGLISKVVGTPGMARSCVPPRGIEKDRQLFDPDFSIEILDGLDPFAVDGQPYDLEVFAAESTL